MRAYAERSMFVLEIQISQGGLYGSGSWRDVKPQVSFVAGAGLGIRVGSSGMVSLYVISLCVLYLCTTLNGFAI